MLEFDDRSELGAGGTGMLGGGQAAPAPSPRPAPDDRAAAWTASAVDRVGFPDNITGGPSPQASRGASSPPVALPHRAEVSRVIRSLLEWGYDPIDLEFMSDDDLHDLYTRHAAAEPGPMPALTREQVTELLLEWGYDPLDLEMAPEEELRNLHSRLVAGVEGPPCPADAPWIFDGA